MKRVNWPVRIIVRGFLRLHAGVTRLFALLGPRARDPGPDGWIVLLTGTFYSDNWINAHLRPLAASRRTAIVHVVATYPVPQGDKIRLHMPPRWLVRLCGAVVARLLLFLWLGLRLRPHLVGGFHLLFNGLMAATLARLVGARSLYFCVGGPAEVLDGGLQSENRLFEKLGAPDPVAERQLIGAACRIDLIVTMGSSGRRFFRERGAPAVVTISGGLDAALYPSRGQRAEFDLIFVGRLASIKRLDLLLGALALARRQRPAIRAVIVGDGPERASLEAQARQLGLGECVRFAGHQTQIASWLARARLFVMCSDTEGLSLALMEAMLCGLPAVVPAVGDLGDLVRDGENGCLIVERTPQAYAARLVDLLGDDARLQRFGAAARRLAQRYELAVCAARWDAILATPAFQAPDDLELTTRAG
ncbi:MAG: glycosyltransferase family 4 protein [Acidobacteria bacterium]|nr:glycosyltransferase family 4 protein [Acidobacteriota bacterium]